MQMDITNVLDKIKSTAVEIKEMDAQDVTAENMKAINHCKKYSDGILEYLKANPDIDLQTLDEIKDIIHDYRNALNEKHGEAQGKSVFLEANSDDINDKFAVLIEISEAAKKSTQLKKEEIQAKNVLASPTNNLSQDIPPSAGWQNKEMSALGASIDLLGYCIKTGVGITCHSTAALVGAGAGLVTKFSRFGAGKKGSETYSLNNSNDSLAVDQAESFVEKNQEIIHIESTGKLVRSLNAIQDAYQELGLKSFDVRSDLLNSITENFDKAKEIYLDSCISLTENSKLKLKALNEDVKRVTENLSESFNSTLTNVSGTMSSWLSKIKEALNSFKSKLQTILQPEKARNVSKGDITIEM